MRGRGARWFEWCVRGGGEGNERGHERFAAFAKYNLGFAFDSMPLAVRRVSGIRIAGISIKLERRSAKRPDA